MSYARFGQESDVYVYLDVGGYLCCCACGLAHSEHFGSTVAHLDQPHSERFGSTEAMLAHLDQHVAAGHTVPKYCFEKLREEAAGNDEWIKNRA